MQKESNSDKKTIVHSFWGKLVSINGNHQNIVLAKEKYTIGSDSFNDICINHKDVQDFHCQISRMKENEIIIENFSDSGVYIDKEHVIKGKSSEILSGNELTFPLKTKNSREQDSIGFVLLVKPPEGIYLKPNKLNVAIQAATKSRSVKVDSELEELMNCKICMEIIYKCVNTLPCQHNFCASCFSLCMKHSSSCPECMEEVEYIEKNHYIDDFITSYLSKHPEKKRQPQEYHDMDENNLIKTERMKVEYKSTYNFDNN